MRMVTDWEMVYLGAVLRVVTQHLAIGIQATARDFRLKSTTMAH